MSARERVELRGIPFTPITRSDLVAHVLEESDAGRGGWIITANVDYLQRFVSEPKSSAVYHNADLIVADGMPLLWAARLQGTPLPDRVAGSDLVYLIAEAAARRGRSLYLLGGNPGAAEAAARTLKARWPELELVGYSSPRVSNPPTDAQIDEIVGELGSRRPAIVYVAFGAPKEELLIDSLRRRFPSTWWIGVGISLSFISGEVKRAPRWMQRVGLEWMHRLWQEPSRLGSRYLSRNLPFTVKLLLTSGLTRLRS